MPLKTPTMPKRESLCVCSQTRKLARRVSQIYDFALKQSGMTVAQYALLNQIRIEPGLSQTELADRAEMDRTSLLRSLRPLEQAGLVLVSPASHGRAKLIALSKAGHERIRELQPVWAQVQDQIQLVLGEPLLLALSTSTAASLAQLKTHYGTLSA
jgi:DNA-binding MarR family transcriptional regulator